MGMVRPVSMFAFVLTLSAIGLPFPVHAAWQDAGWPGRVLTVDGIPLTRLATSTATGAPLLLASVVGRNSGRAERLHYPQRGQCEQADQIRDGLQREFSGAITELFPLQSHLV